MKNMILIDVNSSKPQKVEAQAFSKETANIYITAATTQDATGLLQQGLEMALEACQNWKPEPQPVEEKKPQKHYRLCPVAVEDIEDTLAEYAEDERGSRFIASLENAKAFRDKKDSSGGLLLSQLQYLITLTYKDAWDGVTACFDYGYRRGYNRAKRDSRQARK